MPETRPARHWGTLAIIAAPVVAADQICKLLVRQHIPQGDALTVIPGFFDLVHGYNTGIVFGLFSSAPGFFTVIGLLTIPVLVWAYAALPLTSAGRVAWAAITGGALGNQIDRLTQGQVTDFIDWYVGSHHWYTFNVADACITAGVLAIVGLNLMTPPLDAPAAKHASDTD